jgi:hypothetical protein
MGLHMPFVREHTYSRAHVVVRCANSDILAHSGTKVRAFVEFARETICLNKEGYSFLHFFGHNFFRDVSGQGKNL